MAAASTDYFQKVGDATVTTLAAPGKALAATSITVGSTTNYPTDTGVTIAIRVVDSDGELVAGTYTEWAGTITSGTTAAINGTPVYGSDQVYPAGSTTQVYIGLSKYAHNRLIDGLITNVFDQDATLKAGAVDNAAVLASDVVTTAKILNANVTSAKLADDAVATAKIADSAVTDEKRTSTVSFLARRTTGQTLATGSGTKVQFATEVFDTGADYDNATNYRFVAPYKGIYHFDAHVSIDASGTLVLCYLYLNNTTTIASDRRFSHAASDDNTGAVSIDVQLNATDYVEVFALHNAGADRSLLGGEIGENYFSGHLVGRIA